MKVENQKTILLVEDDTITAMAKQKELEKYGYTIITANTGEKAVQISGENQEIDLILIDCLTLLVSNLLLRKEDKVGDSKREEEILLEIKKLAEISYKVSAQVIIVSNEVGMGLVPETSLGRFYRDILGRANSIIADKADEVFMMVSGISLKIKG